MIRRTSSPVALSVIISVALILCAAPAFAAPVVLADVPAYDWYHGCGPTAAGSIMGYWDLNGYSNLFTASGADVFLTTNVQDQISSPAHNTAYDAHPDTGSVDPGDYSSLACWFETSVNQPYGWSYLSRSDNAFEGYANYRGYDFDSSYASYATMGWGGFTNEIDNERPLMFLVDTDGDGGTDHFVPVFGYEDRGASGLWYACYTTWSEAETVAWYQFQEMGNAWGVGYVTYVVPVSDPESAVPLPATFVLLLTGLAFTGIKKFKK